MPVHVLNVESEVLVEPEPPSAGDEPRPVWRELDRLRAQRARLLRDALRTEASGEHV